jgi:hypothetical protein
VRPAISTRPRREDANFNTEAGMLAAIRQAVEAASPRVRADGGALKTARGLISRDGRLLSESPESLLELANAYVTATGEDQ